MLNTTTINLYYNCLLLFDCPCQFQMSASPSVSKLSSLIEFPFLKLFTDHFPWPKLTINICLTVSCCVFFYCYAMFVQLLSLLNVYDLLIYILTNNNVFFVYPSWVIIGIWSIQKINIFIKISISRIQA